jgi:CBS domain containing-hemolysin-like protein
MTISGLVLEQLGRLPDIGDAVEIADVHHRTGDGEAPHRPPAGGAPCLG